MQKLLCLLILSTIIHLAKTFQCLHNNCDDDEWCHLHADDKHVGIKAKCTDEPDDHDDRIPCLSPESVNVNGGCYCNTVECVQRVQDTAIIHSMTNIQCLDHICQHNELCHLHRGDEEIKYKCSSEKHDGVVKCVGPESVNTHHGCYCDNTECVHNTVHAALMTTVVPTTTTTTTTTQAPVTTTAPIQIQPGMICGGQTCDITLHKSCHLFQYNDVPTGRCMLFNVWQPCTTYTDISHQGCACTTTACISNMLKDFYAHTTTSSGSSPTTASVPATTALPTIAQTITESTTIALPTTVSASITATTHIATPWNCLNVACQPNEACRLSYGLGGIKAVCETAGTGTPDCVDHQSITKVGCLCKTEICVAKTALHCFGNNCPADKTCKISRAVDGSFTGNCSVLDFSHLSFCSKDPTNQQVQCDCWTQSCIDSYQSFTPIAHQPSTVLMSSPLTTAAPTVAVTQLTQTVRSCNKCGDKDLSIPCSNREIIMDLQSTCNTGEDYCMTDVYHDAIGQVDVYKRCVNKATCELEWIGQSADLDYCKKYGVIKNPSAFQCHFCCVSDGCNTNKMPNSTTLFTKV